jgi:YgiT-type zinc finger domain-containing protein
MTTTFERDDATIVIKGVPAEICDSCGEGYLSSEVTKELLLKAEAAANRGVQVDICQYIAA